MSDPRPQTETELIELVRSSDERAPEALHGRIEEMVAERPLSVARGRRSPWGAIGGRPQLLPRLAALAALAAAVVAVLVIVVGGEGRSLSVRQATALTFGHPTAPAPREAKPTSGQLVAAVQGVHFPYWEERFGWRSMGQRTDTLQGHTVMTVFYASRSGKRIGYAIVAGPAPALSGGSVNWLGGHPYRVLGPPGSRTVMWLRSGRLCLLSGRGVASATLLRLASWGERAA
jgi:hypothetical protein